MATVYPITGNNCKGTHADDTPWLKLKCLKGYDINEEKIMTCATWRYFYANCNTRTNVQCNPMSGGYVAANTVCRQGLY